MDTDDSRWIEMYFRIVVLFIKRVELIIAMIMGMTDHEDRD